MQVTALQIFRELEAGHFKPFYLIVGEEPFQASEILGTIKTYFVKTSDSLALNYETFDGESLDAGAMVASLEELPGLLSGPGEGRLILCRNFEKVSTSALEILERYFQNPLESSCCVLVASKVDKRKAWFKSVDAKGYYVEVSNPYDREWPKWLGYFEKKIGKRIEGDAWELLVENSGRVLSCLWADVKTVGIYTGNVPRITKKDVLALGVSGNGVDVFSFADDVLGLNAYEAMEKFHQLLKSGESEVKILAILVRQFRLVEQAWHLAKRGVTDSKVAGPQLGVHPFFVPKLFQQAKNHSSKELSSSLQLLAECDYKLKRGEGALFESFMVPYFSRSS
jgi:DNA polymerase III subunit delta